ncbi:ATP-grasp domain-containing protein [Streptosporangium sp. NPDC020145]|uniref:ATP-grasp domain-containing protein n=1 Tax=Streptosporangium jomthongense TaxID=1193683 RepID=A0ABV8EU24_9ACTN
MTDLDGLSVLIVEPVSGGAALARAAHRLGARVVTASQDAGDCEIPAKLREIVDEVLVVDTNDEAALAEAVTRLHRRNPFDAVLPGCDFYVATAARLAARLGLPGLPVETVDSVRNKALMRESVTRAGLRSPRFAEADTTDRLRSAAEHVGFPCVMKPVESSGSIHVSLARDWPQLLRAFTELAQDETLDLGRPMGHRVIVEQYVPGEEISADGYVADGVTTVVAVTRKVLGAEPRFVELGHLTPADLPGDVTDQVKAYTEDVVRALNVTAGPFHCELRLSDQGPVLIELGARLPGDGIPELVKRVTGVDLTLIMLAAGLGADPRRLGAFGEPVAASAAVRFLTLPEGDSYSGIKGWDELSDLPNVVETHVAIPPGVPVPEVRDCRSRLAHVLYTADSHRAALAFWDSLDERVVIQ